MDKIRSVTMKLSSGDDGGSDSTVCVCMYVNECIFTSLGAC